MNRTIARRAFLKASAYAIVAAPLVVEAQQAQKIHRIGVLHMASPQGSPAFQALRQGLRDLGYVWGKNIVLEYRWPGDEPERLAAVAAQLVRLKVDVIVTADTTTAIAAKQATSEIPIIMIGAGDPVGTGLAASLARPGGNVTGFSTLSLEQSGKRLELLKEALPRVSRTALLWRPRSPHHPAQVQATEEAAQRLGVTLQKGGGQWRGRYREGLPGRRQRARGRGARLTGGRVPPSQRPDRRAGPQASAADDDD